jgi:RHS repeat-associated protein
LRPIGVEKLNFELTENGGAYEIFVDESNLSVYVRLIPNDIIGMDDEYYGYQSTFLNGLKQNMLVSVGTVGGGGGGDEQNSVGEEPVTLNSAPSTNPSLVDTRATTYGYTLDGRRVSKAGVVNLTYLYDGENVIYEKWDNKMVRFTHPSASSCGQKCGSGCGGGKLIFVDHPISISIDGVKYYYLYDGLGSVTELIDASENVVNTYRYTPFGDALVRNELVYNPHQFTGRQYDAESGLYHYRARAYSPDIGRFMQQDPAGMIDGANMYTYVGNNPVNRVDPSGMWDIMAPLFKYLGTAAASIFGSPTPSWRWQALNRNPIWPRAGCEFFSVLIKKDPPANSLFPFVKISFTLCSNNRLAI